MVNNNTHRAKKDMVAIKLCLLFFQYCIVLCLTGRLNTFVPIRGFQDRKAKLFLMITGCQD